MLAYTNHGVAAASGTAATTTGAQTVTAVAGDTIMVNVALPVAQGAAPTVMDSAGNIYTLLLTGSNLDFQWMFAARNIPTAVTSVTVMWGTGSKWAVAIDTWSGVRGFGATNTAAGTSTAPSVVLGSLGTGNWVVAAMEVHGTGTWSANTGNLRKNVAAPSTTTPGAALVDNTAVTCTATLSASKSWVALGVELLAAVPARSMNETVLQAVGRSTTF
jgi:hypothetical protein